MSLEAMFKPTSVAVICSAESVSESVPESASAPDSAPDSDAAPLPDAPSAATSGSSFGPHSVTETADPGHTIIQNLLSGKFLGPVMPLTDKPGDLLGLPTYQSIDTLPLTPDLAIICTPPETIPRTIAELGQRGTQAVVILSRGFFRFDKEKQEVHKRELLGVAKEHNVRVLGPNCLGFINPTVGINASLTRQDARSGKVAFVTQSDALFTTVLDWATSRSIGFSHFISLGDRYDVHFEDVLDYLNNDPATRSVLLYLETIENSRHFMSAARALARNKPVLVVKSGRSEEGARAAAAHSGMLLGSDDVYDTAFRRAGMLRVYDIDTLFDTAETLALAKPLKGNNLAILTNGGGPGFLATDQLRIRGGTLASLSEDTTTALAEALGSSWSYWNPLVLRNDADGETHEKALKILMKDKNIDGILVMHVPSVGADSEEIADHVIKACKRPKKVVLTSWLGGDDAKAARKKFMKAGVPSLFTPDKAIRAFLNLVEYRENQEMLVEAPSSLPDDFAPDTYKARSIIVQALDEQRQNLTGEEAEQILACYQIPVAETRITASAQDAVQAAEELGYPVALKVHSPDVYRKSLVGGVRLDIDNEEELLQAAAVISERLQKHSPAARHQGFTVQRMSRRIRARELVIEVATDPVFGPIIRFGQGGTLAQVTNDRQTALPPLNMSLAGELIGRTKLSALLGGSRDLPATDIDAIRLTLVKVSQLIIDIPEIFELEIDPLFADEHGVVALDCAIRVAWATTSGTDQLAIRPYPRELEECVILKDGTHVDMRPIRPEDEPEHWEFLEHMSSQDKRFRFFGNVATLPRSEMVKLTQIDYDREMAFIATGPLREMLEKSAAADADSALNGTGETGTTDEQDTPVITDISSIADPAMRQVAAISSSSAPHVQPVSVSSEPLTAAAGEESRIKTLAVARAMIAPDNSRAEFAVAVRSDMKRRGLGRLLMDKIIRYLKARGTKQIIGEALGDNKNMIELARSLGFAVTKDYEDDIYHFDLKLDDDAAPPHDAAT